MPKVDIDAGVDGVRSVTLQAPPRHVSRMEYRAAPFGEGDLCDNTGRLYSFGRYQSERLERGDPRLSLEER